jgi:hypothetical protein
LLTDSWGRLLANRWQRDGQAEYGDQQAGTDFWSHGGACRVVAESTCYWPAPALIAGGAGRFLFGGYLAR